MTACSESTAPLGLPGRLRISVRPRTPQTPRLRAAKRILFRSCGAHLLRDALDELRADSACGLGRDIPVRDSGASGGDNQIHLIAEPDELFLDRWLIVRYDVVTRDRESMLPQYLDRRRTRTIFALSARTGIANGEDSSSVHGRYLVQRNTNRAYDLRVEARRYSPLLPPDFRSSTTVANLDALVQRLAHVVDGERSDGSRDQRFHFDSRLRLGACQCANRNAVLLHRGCRRRPCSAEWDGTWESALTFAWQPEFRQRALLPADRLWGFAASARITSRLIATKALASASRMRGLFADETSTIEARPVAS